jgi:hypothetical protein
VHWIDLDQDTDHWRVLVNTVMNLRRSRSTFSDTVSSLSYTNYFKF